MISLHDQDKRLPIQRHRMQIRRHRQSGTQGDIDRSRANPLEKLVMAGLQKAEPHMRVFGPEAAQQGGHAGRAQAAEEPENHMASRRIRGIQCAGHPYGQALVRDDDA